MEYHIYWNDNMTVFQKKPGEFTMKKIIKISAAITLLASLLVLSGCADLSFNPTGEWKYLSDDLYLDDKLISSAGEKDTPYSMIYHFEKDGTGYIAIDNTKTHEFTYTCDEMLRLHLQDIDKKADPIDISYEISGDNKMLSDTLVNIKTDKQKNDDGSISVYREEITLKRI